MGVVSRISSMYQPRSTLDSRLHCPLRGHGKAFWGHISIVQGAHTRIHMRQTKRAKPKRGEPKRDHAGSERNEAVSERREARDPTPRPTPLPSISVTVAPACGVARRDSREMTSAWAQVRGPRTLGRALTSLFPWELGGSRVPLESSPRARSRPGEFSREDLGEKNFEIDASPDLAA